MSASVGMGAALLRTSIPIPSFQRVLTFNAGPLLSGRQLSCSFPASTLHVSTDYRFVSVRAMLRHVWVCGSFSHGSDGRSAPAMLLCQIASEVSVRSCVAAVVMYGTGLEGRGVAIVLSAICSLEWLRGYHDVKYEAACYSGLT